MILIVGVLITVLYCRIIFSNSDLRIEEFESYLKEKDLIYVSHEKTKKPFKPHFEHGEHLFTWIYYRKHHYIVDTFDQQGNPFTLNVLKYQPNTLFLKSKVYFDIENE